MATLEVEDACIVVAFSKIYTASTRVCRAELCVHKAKAQSCRFSSITKMLCYKEEEDHGMNSVIVETVRSSHREWSGDSRTFP